MLNTTEPLATGRNNRRTTCKEIEAGKWLVKCGAASVTIYAVTTPERSYFNLSTYVQGKRKQETRSTFQDARERAETLAGQLDRSEVHNAALCAEEGLIYKRAAAALQPLGLSVDVAALRLVELQVKLGVESLTAAVDFYLANKPAADSSRMVSEVAADFIAARLKDGCGEHHIRTMRSHLKRFTDSFSCPIGSVNTGNLSGWLRGLKVEGRSRNNIRNTLRNFFRYAEAIKAVSPIAINWNEKSGVATARVAPKEISVYTVAEIRGLLAAAEAFAPALVPFVALGAFAGLRTCEIAAQRWEHIDLAAGPLRVTKAKLNTPAMRPVPLTPELRAWLAPYAKTSGLICETNKRNLTDAIGKLCGKAELTWKKNALRHSFISYRVALIKDVPEVALEAGNSPTKIFSNYRALVSEASAKTWFAIRPETAANV